MLRRIACFGCLLAAALATQELLAQDGRAQDEAAVRRAGKEYLAALEKGDSKAIIDCWTANGTYVDEHGHSFKVRELFEKRAATKSASHARHEISSATIRFITPDVAIEEGTCATTHPGSSTPTSGCFMGVWVRQNGKWKLDDLRETRSGEAGSESHREEELLESLEPFVGEWSGEAGKAKMRVTAKWNVNKTFLRREISATEGDKEVFTGTQEIGYDPISKKLKSWSFNADGSRSESVWSLEGTAWIAAGSRLMPDRKTTPALQVFKFRDKNTLICKVMNRDAEGEWTPSFETTLTRRRPNH